MAGELKFSEEFAAEQTAGRERAKSCRWPYQLLLSAVLWLEMLCMAGCLATQAQLAADRTLLAAGAAVCAAVWAAVYSVGRRARPALLTANIAAAGALLYGNRALLEDGLFYFENAVLRLVSKYYGVRYAYYPVSHEEGLAAAAFFIALLWLSGACLAGVLFAGKGACFAAFLLAAAAFCGLAAGVVPETACLVGAVILILLQLVLGRMRPVRRPADERRAKGGEEGRRARAQTAVFFGAAAAGLGIIASLAVSEQVYQERMDMYAKKQRLQTQFEEFAAMPVWGEISERFSEAFAAQEQDGKGKSTVRLGGLNSGRFSRAAQVTFDNVTALIVTLPQLEQPVYLKGYTGAVYTSSGWEELTDGALKKYQSIAKEYGITAQEQGYALLHMIASDSGPVLKSGTGAGAYPIFSRGSMQIEYVTANKKYVYAPYYINPLERGNYAFAQDGYLTQEKQRDILDFTFLLPSGEFLEWFAEAAERNREDETYQDLYAWQSNDAAQLFHRFAERYRSFVYEYYTQLPEGTGEKLAGVVGVSADASVYDKAEAVQRFLSDYEYTLSPGELPEGKDFVDYFLFENKKGYCVHFASSAVLLLRSLGVPARYAEGYLITAQDIAQAETVSSAEISEKWRMSYETDMRSAILSREALEKNTEMSLREVAQKRVEVRDYTAHAWVEVYADDIGWIPVEVTSGYADGVLESRPEELTAEAQKLPSPTPVPTRSVTPTPLPTNTPAPTKAAGTVKEPEITDTPGALSPTGAPAWDGVSPSVQEPSGDEPENEKKTLGERLDGLPAWVRAAGGLCAAAALIALLLSARFRLVWSLRRKRRRTRRGRVLWYYDRMERLLSLQGIRALPQESCEAFARRAQEQGAAEEFVRCQRIALAAGFGRESIREEEAGFVEENYRRLRDGFFEKCSAARKWYVKFIKLY